MKMKIQNILDCLIDYVAEVVTSHTQSAAQWRLKQIKVIKRCQDSSISTMDSSARDTCTAQTMRQVTFSLPCYHLCISVYLKTSGCKVDNQSNDC